MVFFFNLEKGCSAIKALKNENRKEPFWKTTHISVPMIVTADNEGLTVFQCTFILWHRFGNLCGFKNGLYIYSVSLEKYNHSWYLINSWTIIMSASKAADPESYLFLFSYQQVATVDAEIFWTYHVIILKKSWWMF